MITEIIKKSRFLIRIAPPYPTVFTIYEQSTGLSDLGLLRMYFIRKDFEAGCAYELNAYEMKKVL